MNGLDGIFLDFYGTVASGDRAAVVAICTQARRSLRIYSRELDPGLLDLVPELARHTPPAAVVDKSAYSSFHAPGLEPLLRARGIETLVVTGVETDVCVLATILAAVDAGYNVIVPTDAICSSSDETHDALLKLYRERFGEQIEPSTVDQVLARWR